jgi:hypothetical protein
MTASARAMTTTWAGGGAALHVAWGVWLRQRSHGAPAWCEDDRSGRGKEWLRVEEGRHRCGAPAWHEEGQCFGAA